AWQQSKHAHACQTLLDAENDPQRYGGPVTKYPDCVSCHVVGYGQESGFINAEETAHLTDVGCERCHGPGLDHVTSGGAKKLGIIGGVTPSVMCTQCHDYEQSPEFVYGDRWKVIAHGKEPK
ncbi:MAG: cytochrome c family protein, partial [Planctomycetota bacterium]|nr:cytochrome c family protein [Planctomycetota bacterium]